jgi:hypothetical protein
MAQSTIKNLKNKLERLIEIKNDIDYIDRETVDALYKKALNKQTIFNLRIASDLDKLVNNSVPTDIKIVYKLIIELFKGKSSYKKEEIIKIILGDKPKDVDIFVINKAMNTLRYHNFLDGSYGEFHRNEDKNDFRSCKKSKALY